MGAYLIEGDASLLDVLVQKLTQEKIVQHKSPDLYARAYRKFGVDESHDITGRARTRPVDGEHRVFALFIPGITTEAQNALLKTIEEPAANALFFVITPSTQMLLGTVRSRMQVMTLDRPKQKQDSSHLLVDPQEFLSAPAPKRLELLKPLYDHDEDEGRDIGAVIGFLQAIEVRLGALKTGKDKEEGLRALYRTRKYVGDKGSLLKTLLEQMALLMPRL